MNFPKKIVEMIAIDSIDPSLLSTACIATTNPVYLVFQKSKRVPDYVIRAMDTDSAKRAHDAGQLLFNVAGNLVPEPLGLASYKNKIYSVQKGACGLPWFQVSKLYSTKKKWNNIRYRALQALIELHHYAEMLSPADDSYLDQSFQLSSAYDRFCEITGAPSSHLNQAFDKAHFVLSSLKHQACIPQHGDFCLNNMMIGEKDITIIDFEDFGVTQTPLYDSFTLALSFFSSSPPSLKTDLATELKFCTAHETTKYEFSPEVVQSIFLFFLLLRLGDWSLGDKRKSHRKWIMSILEDFVRNPDAFFPTQ